MYDDTHQPIKVKDRATLDVGIWAAHIWDQQRRVDGTATTELKGKLLRLLRAVFLEPSSTANDSFQILAQEFAVLGEESEPDWRYGMPPTEYFKERNRPSDDANIIDEFAALSRKLREVDATDCATRDDSSPVQVSALLDLGARARGIVKMNPQLPDSARLVLAVVADRLTDAALGGLPLIKREMREAASKAATVFATVYDWNERSCSDYYQTRYGMMPMGEYCEFIFLLYNIGR